MTQNTSEETRLVATRDGSHTIYSSRFDQHYHNPNGAVAESRYVFFEQTGLLEDLGTTDELSILEVGFGTGLNLLLLIDYLKSRDSTTKVNYYSVEGFPLSADTVAQFNYEQHLDYPETTSELKAIFSSISRGMNHFNLSEQVSLHLFYGMFEDFAPNNLQANYVFHDAFSPDANPELWTANTFKKLGTFSAENVILSTYSAASRAQGALASAGWKVAKTQGALGKREMILAALDADRLTDYKRINEERYARRYEQDDFD